MRLIDADALPIVARGKNHHRKYVHADITVAPTVEAIPVEWLKACGKRGSLIWIIADILIERWQKEQEDEDATCGR